ncbi:hypothetical protein C0992_006992, partial [Termitomyces sp. T32_za158]
MLVFPLPSIPLRIASDPIRYDVKPVTLFDGNLTVIVRELLFQIHASVFVRQSAQFAKIWYNRPHHLDGKYTLVLREEDPVDFSLLFSALYGMEL